MKTYDYQYAYAISIDEVNDMLKRNLAAVPMRMQFSTTDGDTGSKISLNAELSPWSIVRGGQNTLLRVNVPISQGRLTLEGGAITGDYDLATVSVIVEIRLGWIGAGTQQEAQGASGHTQLIFEPSEAQGQDSPGNVSVIKPIDPNKKLDPVASALLQSYFASALRTNKEALKYILANVNPAPASVASWLNPKRWNYYYTETSSAAALCFLCMLDDTPLPSPKFDSTSLDSKSNVTVLVSQETFFNHVVLPGVEAAFPSASFSLSCTNDQCAITNQHSFDFEKVTVNNFEIRTSHDGNGLSCNASGGGPLKFLFGLANLPDASYWWSVGTVNPLVFKDPAVSFAEDPNPKLAHDQTVYWYDWILLAVVGIANAVGLASTIYDLVNHFSDGVNKTGMSSINSHIQKATGGNIASLSNLLAWRGDARHFVAHTAGLNGAFYVQGTYRST
ncbi:TULIP family P47-like protein [Burkholderia alba]|uniref:TULIP family P47-like protein n=1 Tax=Burkholderia alba TaxID=2683677 RepID=UPI002B055078|nr:TULIP family P47-like protein [Burkholderia alba]